MVRPPDAGARAVQRDRHVLLHSRVAWDPATHPSPLASKGGSQNSAPPRSEGIPSAEPAFRYNERTEASCVRYTPSPGSVRRSEADGAAASSWAGDGTN